MKYNHSIALKSLFLLSLIFVLGSCKDDEGVNETQYELVWEDEFEGEAGQLPDATKWTFDIGTGWGNNQLEYDTDRAENVSTDGQGNLAIVARSEDYEGQSYTSGRIKTQGLFNQTYGRFEARIKMPWGAGLWPAFWLLGSDIDAVSWPQCGEIDIMEYRGQEPTIVHGTVHGPGYSAGNGVGKSFILENDRFDTDFHTFRVDWTEDDIKFYVDDELYQEIKPDNVSGEWVYDHDFFVILNLAVGGSYVGSPNAQTVFPQTMLVDYVKVYKEIE